MGEWHIGVSLFFVLSGFLIATRYYENQRLSLSTFYINRVARIYPLFFLLALATWFYDPGKFQESGESLFVNLILIKGYFKEFLFSGIPQTWSLTVEESFYIVAPALFFLVRKSKWNLVFLPIFMVLIGFILVKTLSNYSLNGLFEDYKFMLVYTFPGRVFEFFTGIALSLFIKKVRIKKYKFPFFTLLGILGITTGILVMTTFKGDFETSLHHPTGIFFNNLFIPILGFAPLFYGLIIEKTWFKTVLSSPLFLVLGKSSYAFYLIHIGIIPNILDNYQLASSPILKFLELNLVAIALYYLWESPINRGIKSIMRASIKIESTS